MGKIGFLFGIEDGTDKKSIVVFVDKPKLPSDVILGVDYLKVDKTQFFVLDRFHDLAEFFIMDNAKLLFGKISLAKDKIVSFDDFVFWFKADDYKIIREQLFIVNVIADWAILESELKDRTLRLAKMFDKYLG